MLAIPKVTVLMPVYNGAKYLGEAIESVLAQTFTDFELLIIDDGSTDDSVDIIRSLDDGRIRLVHNEKNLGLVESLNLGIGLAGGEYVARMDSDDVCLPHRLHSQVVFMDANPMVGICGSWARSVDSATVWKMPVTSPEIKANLLLNSAFLHPSVMMRRSLLVEHGLTYRNEYRHAEDYDLWVRAASLFLLANIPEILIMYRVHHGQVSQGYHQFQQEAAGKIRKYQLERIGVFLSDDEKSVLDEIGSTRPIVTRSFLATSSSVLSKILKGNHQGNYLDQTVLRRLFSRIWLDLCLRCQQRGPSVVFTFFRSLITFRFSGLRIT